MNTYKRHRFPPDVISYAVWLYYRFNLNGTYSFTFEQNVINMAEILSPLTGKMGELEK